MDHQELVDRLVTAVGEEDVLYTLYWLNEMRKEGMLEQERGLEGLHGEHSWKRHSALIEAVLGSCSIFRTLILELLLHHVNDPTQLAACGAALSLRNGWAYEIMSEWTSGRRERAAHAQHLLSLEVADAGDWIDENLPPHLAAASMTGYGPLPERPAFLPTPVPSSPPTQSPPASTAPTAPAAVPRPLAVSPTSLPLAVAAPPPSSLGPRPHPSLPPPSWGNPRRQIRLSGISPIMSLDQLRAKLPSMGGLSAMNILSSSTVILTFSDAILINVALPALQDRQDLIVAQRELDYQASIGYAPPSASSARRPPPSDSTSIPVSSFAAAGCPDSSARAQPASDSAAAVSPNSSARVAPASIHLRLVHLPHDASLSEIDAMLRYAGVCATSPRLQQTANSCTFHFGVASDEQYALASKALHGATLRRNKLSVSRSTPAPDPLHPSVIVHRLALNMGLPGLELLVKGSGCGGYGMEMYDAGDGVYGIGVFRVASEQVAQVAVDYIERQVVQSVKLQAEYRLAHPPQPEGLEGAGSLDMGAKEGEGAGDEHGEVGSTGLEAAPVVRASEPIHKPESPVPAPAPAAETAQPALDILDLTVSPSRSPLTSAPIPSPPVSAPAASASALNAATAYAARRARSSSLSGVSPAPLAAAEPVISPFVSHTLSRAHSPAPSSTSASATKRPSRLPSAVLGRSTRGTSHAQLQKEAPASAPHLRSSVYPSPEPTPSAVNSPGPSPTSAVSGAGGKRAWEDEAELEGSRRKRRIEWD